MWTRPFVDKLKSSKPDRFFMQLLTQGETKCDTVNFLCEEKRKERTILPEWIIRLKSLHLAKLFSFQTFKFFLLIRELVTENGPLPPWDMPAGMVVECIILGLLDWTFVLMNKTNMISFRDISKGPELAIHWASHYTPSNENLWIVTPKWEISSSNNCCFDERLN